MRPIQKTICRSPGAGDPLSRDWAFWDRREPLEIDLCSNLRFGTSPADGAATTLASLQLMVFAPSDESAVLAGERVGRARLGYRPEYCFERTIAKIAQGERWSARALGLPIREVR